MLPLLSLLKLHLLFQLPAPNLLLQPSRIIPNVKIPNCLKLGHMIEEC
jgi:hypothetical protein